MTWPELCERAKEMGAGIGKQCIYFGKLEFDKDGRIYLEPFCWYDDIDGRFQLEDLFAKDCGIEKESVE